MIHNDTAMFIFFNMYIEYNLSQSAGVGKITHDL